MEKTTTANVEKVRYHLLDTVRGICIILVVLYHILYNLSEVFGGNFAFFNSCGMNLFRDCFVGVLIILSGISCQLSKSNLKRGFKTLLWALVITSVTATLMPHSIITFGILHFFSASMILFGIFQRPLDKISTPVGIVVFAVLFMLTENIYYGFIGIEGLYGFSFPNMPDYFIFSALGFATKHFSADYWPIFPWFFLFLVGTFLGRPFKNKTAPQIFKSNPLPFLSLLGRHTLWIYLIHQPVIYGIMLLLFEFF